MSRIHECIARIGADPAWQVKQAARALSLVGILGLAQALSCLIGWRVPLLQAEELKLQRTFLWRDRYQLERWSSLATRPGHIDRGLLDQPFLATCTVSGHAFLSDSEKEVADGAACCGRRFHGVGVGVRDRVQTIFIYFPPGREVMIQDIRGELVADTAQHAFECFVCLVQVSVV